MRITLNILIMIRTKKEINEMYTFVKLMSIIYKEMGADLFNNLQSAIDEIKIEIEESEQEIIDKYSFQLQKKNKVKNI